MFEKKKELVCLLNELDRCYPVPSRTQIMREIDQLVIEMKTKVQTHLAEARKIHFCIDIWTKRGMSSSYLGITAHFFSLHDHRIRQAVLAVRRINHPQTAENICEIFEFVLKEWNIPQSKISAILTDNICEIFEFVLKEWNIPQSKISAILTDNGSNMIKAFKQQLEEQHEETEEELEEEEEFFETNGLNENFDNCESQDNITFRFLGKRLSCFAHTLQIVILKFDSNEKSFDTCVCAS